MQEAARLQGFEAHKLKWSESRRTRFEMLGNTMSVNILQRILVAVLRVLGHKIIDPWTQGTAIDLLAKDATKDEMKTSTYKITSYFKPRNTGKP